ncbi:MAG: YHYH protein [Acidimicrobiales bacterium]|nr:YHYH protein [Acidimicrobiales bacterium]
MNATIPPRRLATALLAATMLLGACGSDATSSTDTGADSTDTTDPTNGDAPAAGDVSTLAGVEAAQWSDTIALTVDDASFTFASNGIPDHELPDQFLVPNDGNMPPFTGDDIEGEFSIVDTDELIVESPIDTEITLFPEYSDEITETSLGMIGALLDGFPIYGNKDVDGASITSDELDECSGHVGPTPEFPDGIYHHHLTEDANPYSIDCYHGEVDASVGDAGAPGAPGGGGPPPGAGGPPPAPAPEEDT